MKGRAIDKGTTSPTAQRNIDAILAWLDAHNRQDMKAIDCYTDDIEIVEMPTGVVYKGMDKMRELAAMAYRRKGWKELTNIHCHGDGGVCGVCCERRHV
jgi:ketosteroid isomerase-like protein